MKKKTLLSTAVSTAITMATVAGIAVASSDISTGSAISQFQGQGTLNVDSIRVGDTISGGVTFFNGTVVNEGGAFTIGDHVRIDGNIHRGQQFGINVGDNKPLRFNDEVVSMGTHTFEQGVKITGGSVDFANNPIENFPGYDHNHDSRYFTESETTALLANKADTNHTHDDRYYTESEVDTRLSTKADSSDVASNTSAIATKAEESAVDQAILNLSTTVAGKVDQSSPSWNATTNTIMLDPSNATPDEGGSFTLNNTGGLESTNLSFPGFTIPLNLPAGNVITSFKVYAHDNDTSTINDEITVTLQKLTLNDSAAPSVPAFLGTGGTNANMASKPDGFFSVSSIGETIDASARYEFLISFIQDDNLESADLQLYGIEVTYTTTTPN